jgi:hypothetical protein
MITSLIIPIDEEDLDFDEIDELTGIHIQEPTKFYCKIN